MELNTLPSYIPTLDQLLDRSPLIVTPEMSVLEVLKQMNDHPHHPVGYVVVQRREQLVGIFTERDLVNLISSGETLEKKQIQDVMTSQVVTLKQQEYRDIYTTISLLREQKIRHLPVVDDEGQLQGVITEETLRQNQIIEERVQQRLLELRPIAPSQHPTPETGNPIEQQHTEAELQKAHQQLTFHVENSPLAVIEWDEQFRVKRWSPQAEKIFGWKAEELLNLHWNQWQFVHPEDLEQVNAIASRLLNGQESRNTCCNRNYTKQGVLVYCEWYNSVLNDKDGQVVSLLSLIQDVTIRQTAQQELKRRARQQQVIAELGQYALSQTNLDALLQQVVTLIGQTLGIKYVQIWELLPNEATFLLTAGLGWRSGSVGRVTVGNGCQSQPGYTLFRQEPVIVEDLRVETRFSGCAFFYNHNIVSGVTVLIAGKEKPFGVLGIHSEHERTFSPDEINFLQASANIIASGVERQQAEDELNRFFNLSLDIFCIASTQGYFKRVNPRMVSLLGYNENELLEQSFLTLIHPDDLDSTRLELENLSLGIPSHNFENRYQCKNGSYRWLSWTAMPFDETQYYAVARNVTENKQTEAALRKSEKRYATLAEVSPVGIFHCDIEGNCLYINQRWCEIAGLTPEEALGKGWAQAIHPEDQQSVAEEWHRLQRPHVETPHGASPQKIQFCSEYRFQRQDGQITWVFGQAVGELNDQGEIIGYVGTITDISAQKQAEAELKTLNEELEVRVADRTTELSFMNEKLHRQVIELQKIESQLEYKAYQQAIIAELGQKALSETNLTALINEIVFQVSQDLNVEYCKVLEYNLENGFLTLSVWDEPSQNYILLSHEPLFLRPLMNSQVSSTQDNLKSNFSPSSCKFGQNLELTELHYGNFNFLNQGIYIPILGQNYHHLGQVEIYGKKMQLFSEDDVNYLQSVANILATAIERKQAEEVIRKSEQLYRLMADHSTDLISRHTPLGVYLYASPASRSLLGYEPEELVGRSAYELFHPEDLAKINPPDQTIVKTADINTIVYRILNKNQEYVWFETTQKMVRDATGNIQEIVAISRDITERKRVEEQLRLSERAIAYSSNGIVIADARQPDYPIVFVNPAFEKVTGYSAEEAIGKNSRFLQGEDHQQAELKQIKKALKQNKNCNVVLRNYRKDGTLFWNKLNISQIYDEAGNLTHYLEIQNDITESKLAEERLGQQVIRERLIATITQRIRESLDLKSILSTMVTEVKQFLKADRVLVYRIYSDHTGSVIAEAVNPEWCSLLEQTFSEEIFPSECHHLYIQGKIASIANINDQKLLPCLVEFLTQFQVQAKVAVPIIENETLWGLLIAHQCSQPRQWEEWEISLLEQITSQLAIAIQQSELYEQLQTELKERSLAQQALLVSQERLKYLLSSSPGIIYDAQPGGDYQFTFISDNIKTLLGYNVSEFTQPGFWLNHIHPEDIGRITNQELSPLFEQGYCSYEYRFQHQDGTYHWIYDQAKLIRDSQRNPLEVVGYWIDISDRKQAEERLKATNEQLQAVLDAVPGFVSWISSDLHYLGVNRHLANTYNLKTEDFVGQEIGFLQGSHEFAEFMEQFMREPDLKTSEVTLEAKIQDITRYYLLVAQKYNQDQAAIFIGIDITERKRIEEQLWATTYRLSTLIENLQLGVLVQNEFHKIVLINQAFCDLFNIQQSPDKLIDMDGSTFAFEYQDIFTDPTQFIIRNQEVMRRKRVVANEELSLVDGRTFERDYVPIMIQGTSQGHLWMYRDITERKKGEDTLVTSLREKEVLLKEIHHRVKNNLLVVSNLLEFQSDYVQEPGLIKVLEDSRNRIYSMALIHEKLYRSTNLEKINFGDYLEDLIDNLFESYNIQDGRVQFELDIEPVGLNIETAQPCGLIVNELVSNTLKHAFPNPREGIVYLGLHQDEEDKIIVTVRDNGIGFPEGVDFRNVESLGMELVCTLTEQLEGTITLDRENGTVFTVSFSELQYRHRL